MLPLAAILLLAQQGAKLPPIDRWAAPTPRVFASASGLFGFKVIPAENGTKAVGALFSMDTLGTEVELWRHALENVPVEVYVSDGGHVATLDEWGSKGKKHALVLYEPHGKTVADLELKGIFPELKPDADPFILKTPSSYHWTLRSQVGFYSPTNLRYAPDGVFDDSKPTASGYIFWIRTIWGEQVRYDPDTGKLMDRKKYRT